ncbi:MAG: SUMF1/EgtB/PvdO family nonheme iron enzyme [Pseudomonadota bacterium]
MSITGIRWRHGDNEKWFKTEDLPLVIGTTAAADIRLSGPGGQALAQLDLVDGNVIVQPLLRPSPMQLDGQKLDASTTLRGGQVLEAYGLKLSIEIDGDALAIVQDSRAGAFETQPPELTATDDDAPIEVQAWQPAVAEVESKSRGRGIWIAIGTALALLACVALWFTTSIPVRIETSPVTAEQMRIVGPGFPLKVGERHLLRRGVYEVSFDAEGFHPLRKRVEVTGDTSVLVFDLEPLPGSVEVIANAPGAQVTLTDAEGRSVAGELPARLDGLLPGSYEFEISAPGYVTWQDQVSVIGLGQVQDLNVVLLPDAGFVSVATTPAGASVYLLNPDGQSELLSSETPATITVPAGKQNILYQLDGYKPVERAYEVSANAMADAQPIVFEPADASLRVVTRPAGASVTINGRYRGLSPVTLALDPGRRYAVSVARSGYATSTRNLTLRAAERRNLNIDLNAQVGRVSIRAIPTDAEIFVNGRGVGTGTVALDLPAEPHRISVRKEGYAEWTGSVTPRAGFEQTVDARMQTLEEARLAKIQQTLETKEGQTLRYVTGGAFQRGTSRREADRRSDEPLRDVRITQPFYVSIHEVTNEQFSRFKREHVRGGDVYPSLAGDKNPVVNVSWQDAAAYCNWLSAEEGLEPAYTGEAGVLRPASPSATGYRLPTEAQWIWLARYQGRAGSPLRFGWGNALPPPQKSVNVADEASESLLSNMVFGYNDGYPSTAPVGSFKPNRLGVFDLDGNVREWMHDFYEVSPPDVTLIDPTGPPRGQSHVIRGAGWRDANVQSLRLASRASGSEGEIDVGFRIVRPAPR